MRFLHAVSLATAVAAAGLPVLAQNAQSSRAYEDALRRYGIKDLDGAEIQLKNVLQADRRFLPAHLLLGKIALENSNPNAAEAAFVEALRLGASRGEVVVPLAKALVAQGQHQRMLDDPNLNDEGLSPSVLAQLLLVRAAALTDLGKERPALGAIDKARRLNEADPDVWLAEVPLRIRAGAFDAALAATDKALRLEPNNAEAHYSRGTVLHAKNDLKSAMLAYGEALQRSPDHLETLIARAGISVDRQQFEQAKVDLATLRKRHPKEPRADYLSALIAEREGKPAEATAAMRRVADLIDPAPLDFLRYRPQLLMLGGLAHHALGEPEKAIPFLDLLVKQQPRNPSVKLLAQILFQQGQVENGIQLLENYLGGQPQDVQAVALLASGHIAQGRHAKATQLMRQALRNNDSVELRSVLGQSLMRAGKLQEAQQELEIAFKRDAQHTPTGIALTNVYLSTRQLDKAVSTAQNMISRSPGRANLHQLLGTTLAAKRDFKGARAAFEKAFSLDRNAGEAQLSLARIDAQEGQVAAAMRRLEDLHKRDERAIEPMLELAGLERRERRADAAARWLEKAVAVAGPKELRPHFALVDLHMSQGQPAKALEAAKPLLAKGPEDAQVLVAYARTMLANQQPQAARPHLVQASRRLGFDATRLTEVASLQLQARDLPAARYTIGKALEAEPGLPDALVQQATILMELGEIAEATKDVSALLNAQPRQARSHLLAAELAMAKRDPAAALQALRRAHELQPSTATTMRLVLHLSQFDPGPGAIQVAEAWIKRSPRDITVRRALGEIQIARGQLPAAKQTFEGVLKLVPEDPQALNNLAVVSLRQGDLRNARALAERGLKRAADNPYLIDTLAWALHLSGENDRALGLLRDARLRAPDNAEIRYHLAAVLAKLGRTAEAKTELSAALAAPAGLESLKEAQALQATLK